MEGLTFEALFLGSFAAFFASVFVLVIIYVYSAVALMTIARKTNTQNDWLAALPVANVYLVSKIAGVSGRSRTLILLAFLLFIVVLIHYVSSVVDVVFSIFKSILEYNNYASDYIGTGSGYETDLSQVDLSQVSAVTFMASIFLISLVVLSAVGMLIGMVFMIAVFFGPIMILADLGLPDYGLPEGLLFSLAISIIVYALLLPVYAFLWWKIAEARQKPGWISLLMLIPVVNLVVLGFIAWKD